MYILGISAFYHDSAATLIKDGKLIAAAEEERFTRKKHDNSFPVNAVNFCLKQAGIAVKDLDYVGFYEKPLIKFERLIHMYLESFPRSFWAFYKAMPSWINEKLRINSVIKKKLKYKKNIIFIDHHRSHAASSFFVSPFKEAAILTADGVGEWTTTSYGVGKDNQINMLKEIRFPSSLGLLYTAITAYLGFKANNDEYKVMGLASYGEPKYYDQLKKLIDVLDDGSYNLNLDYFAYHRRMKMLGKKFYEEFGIGRKKGEKIDKRHEDMAASLQKLLEEVMVKIAKHIQKETKQKYLCIAGGVGLNCVANAKILKETKFERIFIQPAATDAGGSLGVAYYIWHSVLNNPKNFVMENAYLGPSFTTEEIREYLVKNNIKFEEYNEKELLKKTAQLIAKNYIVGWFQGRMEFGPRALGNRSILANPCSPEMKDILNNKVKHREDFRPFAPVAPIERASEYFEIMQPDPFMVLICNVKKGKYDAIPSVTHADGTARLQTIERKQNPRYYDLILEFEKLTKVPVLINTSFNVRGMPIVCSPENAYNCFANTGIDYLVMDRFIIGKD